MMSESCGRWFVRMIAFGLLSVTAAGCGASDPTSSEELQSDDLTTSASVKVVARIDVAKRLNDLLQERYGRQICAGAYDGKTGRQFALWVQAPSGFDRCPLGEYALKRLTTISIVDEAILFGPEQSRIGFLQDNTDFWGNRRKEVTLCAVGQCFVSVSPESNVVITMVTPAPAGGGIRY